MIGVIVVFGGVVVGVVVVVGAVCDDVVDLVGSAFVLLLFDDVEDFESVFLLVLSSSSSA